MFVWLYLNLSAQSQKKAAHGIRIVICPTFHRDGHKCIDVAAGGLLKDLRDEKLKS